MEEKVLMPKLGLTMTRGTVVKWHKAVGDIVDKGDIVCDVETEKIVDEVSAPCDGRISKILVQEGEEQAVLQPVCLIEC